MSDNLHKPLRTEQEKFGYVGSHPVIEEQEFGTDNSIPRFGAAEYGDKGVSNQTTLKAIFGSSYRTAKEVTKPFIMATIDTDHPATYNPDFEGDVDFTYARGLQAPESASDDPELQPKDKPQPGVPNTAYPSEPTAMTVPNTEATNTTNYEAKPQNVYGNPNPGRRTNATIGNLIERYKTIDPPRLPELNIPEIPLRNNQIPR
jgi:hypothetical protein